MSDLLIIFENQSKAEVNNKPIKNFDVGRPQIFSYFYMGPTGT